MNDIFLSTSRAHGLYDFIIKASKLNAEKKINKKLKLKVLKEKKITLNFIYFLCIFLVFKFFFNWKKIILLKYKNCEIGRFAIAKTFRDVSSYKNNFYLYFNLIKNLFLSGVLVDTALSLKGRVKAVFIDHIGYLNGSLFSIFSKYKIKIYTNAYPRSLFFIDFSKNKNFPLRSIENTLKLRFIKKKKIKPRKAQIKFYKKILTKPNLIPYMKYTKFSKIEKLGSVDWKSYNYIIYAHSFLDAQLWLGYDGFKNLYDWLNFTINELTKKNCKIIIKSHPNFYNTSIGEMSQIDKILFNKIFHKYQSKNILFINEPIKNYDLLKKVSKKTILISHHGSALLEGMYLGFKCISSKSTFWSSELKLTNQWQNKEQYTKVLFTDWKKLKYANKDHLNYLLFNVFWKDKSIYGKNYFLEIISRISKIKRDKMYKLQHELKVKKELKKKIIFAINKNIEEIKI